MNLKGKLIANSTLTATTTIPKVINTGGASTWNEISGKPFSTVDTESGLTIQDDTLMIDTLDTIATINYVDTRVKYVESVSKNYTSEFLDYERSVPAVVKLFTDKGNNTYFIDGSELAAKVSTYYPRNGCLFFIRSTAGYMMTIFPSYYGRLTWTDIQYPSTYEFIGIDGLCSWEYANRDGEIGFWFTPHNSDIELRQIVFGENGIKQDINAWFIPVDNQTIKINSQGKLYTDAAGGLEPDEKSIITNAQNKLEQAVPVYSEDVLIQCGPGLYFDGTGTGYYNKFSYPADIDLDVQFQAPFGIDLTTGYSDLYRFAIEFSDGTIKDGSWEPATTDGHDYGGYRWHVDNTTYEMYIELIDHYDYKLHVYMNGNYISSADGGNVVAVCLYEDTASPHYPANPSMQAICRTNSLVYDSINSSTTTTIIHQLPAQYIPIDNNTIINNNGVLQAVGGGGGGSVYWNDIIDKPFDNVDTTSGLVIYDDTLMIDTLDTIATIDYVDNSISELSIPEDVSELNNDAGYITSSALNGYATEQYVDDAIDDIDLSNYVTQAELQQVDDEIPHADNITIIDNNGVWSAVGGSSENSLYKTKEVTLASASQSFTAHTTDGIIERSYVTSGKPLGDIFNFYETGDKIDVNYTLNNGTSGTETLYYVSKIGVGAIQYSTSNYSAWVIEDYKDSAVIPYNDINQMSNKFLGIFKVSANGLYVFLAKASSGNYITSVSCGERTLHQVRLTIPVQGGLKATDTVLYAPTISGQGGIQVSESSGGDYSTYNLSIAPNAGIVPLYLNGNGVRTSFGGGLIAGYTNGFKNITCTLSNNNTTAAISISGVSSGKYIAYIGIIPSSYTGQSWNTCIIREIIIDFSNNTVEGAEEYIASYSKSSTVFILNARTGWAFTKNISIPGSTGWRAIQADSYYPLDWSNKFESRYIPIDETTLVRNSEGRISSAIPTPPTTDGTYTLQVTVSNGEPTYSWI